MSADRFARWTCAYCGRPNPFYSEVCVWYSCQARRPVGAAEPGAVGDAPEAGGVAVASDLPARTTPADPPLPERTTDEERRKIDDAARRLLGLVWDAER